MHAFALRLFNLFLGRVGHTDITRMTGNPARINFVKFNPFPPTRVRETSESLRGTHKGRSTGRSEHARDCMGTPPNGSLRTGHFTGRRRVPPVNGDFVGLPEISGTWTRKAGICRLPHHPVLLKVRYPNCPAHCSPVSGCGSDMCQNRAGGLERCALPSQ